MKEQYSPNIPYPLLHTPNGIGVVDGIGYINLFFTQGSKIPEDVKIELEGGVVVDGSYDNTTGHYTGDFLPSYGADKIYHIKGKAITGSGVEVVIDIDQAINEIPGMVLEVSNIHVTDDSVLVADLKLNIAYNIRSPERVYPSLTSVFSKGVAQRVSIVSWDAKTNTGRVGFKMCSDCSTESLRAVQSTLEVDNKRIDFSIQYLTPAVNIELKSISVDTGIMSLDYKFNGGNSQIPFTAEVVGIKIFETGSYAKLVEDVKTEYSHRYGTLSIKLPVTIPTIGKIDHVITGVFKLDGGTVSRPLQEKFTSYLKADKIDSRVIEHYITEDGKYEVAKLKSMILGSKFPVALVIDEVSGYEGRKLVRSVYEPKVGILSMAWEVNLDKSVKTTLDLSVVASYPDYDKLKTKFSSSVTPNYYLFPPKVTLVESGITQKEGRLYMNVTYTVRYADGSIPSSMVRSAALRNATFNDIRKYSEVTGGYDEKTGVGTLIYPIKELRYINDKVGVSIDLTFPTQNKNVYAFRFGSLLKLPLAPQILNKRVTVNKETKKVSITFNALEADGSISNYAGVTFPFEIAEGVAPDSATGNAYSILDGEVEVIFDTEDPTADHKFKTTVIVGNNIKPVILEI